MNRCAGICRAWKLDLLLNIPAMYNRALAEFDQAVAADPSNFRLLLSYASLLESTDTEKGRDHVQESAGCRSFTGHRLVQSRGLVCQPGVRNKCADADRK